MRHRLNVLAILAGSTSLLAQGGALELTNGHVEVAANPALAPSAITIEAWIEQTQRRQYASVFRKTPILSGETFSFRIETDRPVWVVHGTNGYLDNKPAWTLPLNKPMHVAVTYDGTSSAIYIDGVLVSKISGTAGPLKDLGGKFLLGQGGYVARDQFVGKIDEVRVWNRALSTAEIVARKNEKVHQLPGQIATYQFDNGYADSTGSYPASAVGNNTFVSQFVPLLRVERAIAPFSGGDRCLVKAIGDWDGDGYDDYAMGHPNLGVFQPESGYFAVVSGKTQQREPGSPGKFGFSNLGASLAAGDLDQDGKIELLVGEPGNREGRIYTWRAGSSNTNVLMTGSTNATKLGAQLAVGQLDGIAGDDFVTCELRGSVWYLLAFQGRSGKSLWAVPVAAEIGSLVVIPDANGDGRDDVIIGLPSFNAKAGQVEFRSGRNGNRFQVSISGSSGEEYGASIASVGDLDFDAVPDIAIGGPGFVNGLGTVDYYSVRRATRLSVRRGTTAGERFGTLVSSAGDVNADGFPDVHASDKNGEIWTLSGRDATTVLARRSTGGALAAISSADLNGDSEPDLIYGEAKRDPASWAIDRDAVPNPPALVRYGQTCAGSGGFLPRIWTSAVSTTPNFVEAPPTRPGETVYFHLSSGPKGSVGLLRFAYGRSNIALDAIGMLGCEINSANSIVYLPATIDAQGRGNVAFPIPGDWTSYVGAKLNFEWLLVDTAANSIGLTLSDAAEMRLGQKL
ncbi:MAG: VCBS repeat-containing protein [Planctomycetes bacterium]|nr:VCBS repeat-containing protein [Planctomycetota bacterium]